MQKTSSGKPTRIALAAWRLGVSKAFLKFSPNLPNSESPSSESKERFCNRLLVLQRFLRRFPYSPWDHRVFSRKAHKGHRDRGWLEKFGKCKCENGQKPMGIVIGYFHNSTFPHYSFFLNFAFFVAKQHMRQRRNLGSLTDLF